MSKHDKKCFSLAEDLQAVATMIPRLECLLKAHKEIAEGYQTYRKNGGEEIPALEQHMGLKKPAAERNGKKKKPGEDETAVAKVEIKKTKKKDK
ncbi:MAG: hypothetical protein P4L42_13025 [Desulfocapsaceae bacterium]|nr:hypothetical protein [Desulfocapsaceae bacterium]